MVSPQDAGRRESKMTFEQRVALLKSEGATFDRVTVIPKSGGMRRVLGSFANGSSVQIDEIGPCFTFCRVTNP